MTGHTFLDLEFMMQTVTLLQIQAGQLDLLDMIQIVHLYHQTQVVIY